MYSHVGGPPLDGGGGGAGASVGPGVAVGVGAGLGEGVGDGDGARVGVDVGRGEGSAVGSGVSIGTSTTGGVTLWRPRSARRPDTTNVAPRMTPMTPSTTADGVALSSRVEGVACRIAMPLMVDVHCAHNHRRSSERQVRQTTGSARHVRRGLLRRRLYS
jgi:hypothetical protein